MKIVMRYQKLGTSNIKRGEVSCNDINHLIKVMGEKGYHVIHYYEKSDTDVFIVPTA